MLYDWGTLSDVGARALSHDDELAIYLLTPGFSSAYHRQVLGVSNATLWKYGQWARELSQHNDSISASVIENVGSITRDDGLLMAHRRGRAQLIFWSRLAVCEFLQIHGSATAVAKMFGCSTRNIYNVHATRCLSYDALSGERKLSSTQIRPPASRDQAFA